MASSERAAREKTPGVRVGAIAGVPVFIGWSWLLLAGLITWLRGEVFARTFPELGTWAYAGGLAVALGLLVSVLVHEAAHAVSARAFGLHVRRIVADLMGGHTAFDGRTTPWSQGVTALSGPSANLVAAAMAWVASWLLGTGLAGSILLHLAVLNVLLAVFNLLPGLPLDGGQVLMAVVWRVTGSAHTASVVAGWAGRVVAVLVVAAFLLPPVLAGSTPDLLTLFLAVLIASFLWRGASQSILVGRARARIDSTPLSAVMRPVTLVPADGPIASWWAGPDRVYVTRDLHGQPGGIVRADVVATVPPAEWVSVPASAVAVAAPQGWMRDFATAPGLADVLSVMAQSRLEVLLVGHEGRVQGIVFGADAVRAVE